MAIGRRGGYRRNYDWERQTEWNEETRRHGQGVRFSSTAPPLDWENQHTKALITTAIAHTVDAPTAIANRPVPRRASCHYFALDNDHRNVYFY